MNLDAICSHLKGLMLTGRMERKSPPPQGVLAKPGQHLDSIWAAFFESTFWYLAFNHLPNASSLVGNKEEKHLLPGALYYVDKIFTTDFYELPLDPFNWPVRPPFFLSHETMSLSASSHPHL